MTRQQKINIAIRELEKLRADGADEEQIEAAELRLYELRPDLRPITPIDVHDGMSRALGVRGKR